MCVCVSAETGSSSSQVLASSSADSLSTQDSDDHSRHHMCHEQRQSWTSRGGACDDDEDADSCSVLQTDESMEATSASQDECGNDSRLASDPDSTRSILCSLLRYKPTTFSQSEDDDAGDRPSAYPNPNLLRYKHTSDWLKVGM